VRAPIHGSLRIRCRITSDHRSMGGVGYLVRSTKAHIALISVSLMWEACGFHATTSRSWRATCSRSKLLRNVLAGDWGLESVDTQRVVPTARTSFTSTK
jgi:hypothetical protein